MKTINLILTVCAYILCCMFFTPFVMGVGINIESDVSATSIVGCITSSISGTILSLYCAEKFNKWFKSNIK